MGTFAIIALILSAVATIGSGVANYINTKKTNETNQQMYNDWKEYNTPLQQMERLEDAGLNPYLVSNVGNTLSEPFKIGQNNGIAESLTGLSNSLASGAQFAQSHYENELNRDIQRQNMELRSKQLELNQLGLNIREMLARNALKIGDARTALLWSQGRAQDLNNMWLSSSFPYRLDSLFYGNMLQQQLIDHNAVMNPLLESYYEPMQRAKLASIYRRNSHYDFMESYLNEKLQNDILFDWSKYYNQKDYMWQRFQQAQDMFNLRLGLSRDYKDLAERKFHWNNFFRGVDAVSGYIRPSKYGYYYPKFTTNYSY